MPRYFFLVFVSLFILLQSAFAGPLEEGWKQAKQGDGIIVYTRPIPGAKISEFLGITDVNAPMEVVLEVYRDYPSFPQWFGFCKDIRLVKDFTKDHKIMYYILSTPWPVTNRDVIIDVVFDVNKDQGKSIISINGLKDELVPIQSKYVRMTRLVGKCVLTRVNDSTTHVVYTVNSDPAGYIPAWASNLLAKDQPYNTLKGLKEMVKKDVYYEKAGMKRKG
jgi:hypothetical protein